MACPIKKHRTSANPLSASDEMYTDSCFRDCTKPLRSPFCSSAVYREAKLCYKHYTVWHIKQYLQDKHGISSFQHSDRIVSFAAQKGKFSHFVDCWFSAFNDSSPLTYIPEKKYTFRAVKKAMDARKIQQQIYIDMVYTAKKYFREIPMSLRWVPAEENEHLFDVVPAIAFIEQYLRFMFYNKLPAYISAQLYNNLSRETDRLNKLYTIGDDGAAYLKDDVKAYGALVVLGEHLATELFLNPDHLRSSR